MIKVSLIAQTNEVPVNLISHAARTCYTSTVPEMGNLLDVENQLFKTGHHTTLQHNYFTFNIDGLSVSSVTFGLHLAHSFYNTDQRSGRYSKMYTKPDFDEIQNYILKYWPDCQIEEIMAFIKKGRELYKNNIKQATEVAARLLKEERPFASNENIEAISGKIAQEQMRMFISTISPSALDYTINLSALTAIYRSAWSPELRDITEQMKDLVLDEYPELEYMFNTNNRRLNNWTPKMDFNALGVLKQPQLHEIHKSFYNNMHYNFDLKTKDSVDLKYFTPEAMNNNIFQLGSEIELSIASMGQEQRHRTIRRSEPLLTGNFYLPPILDELGLEKEAIEYMSDFRNLYKTMDRSLALAIAPYGVMVRYRKIGDINAIIHEQEKRLCWAAQEEIYNLSRQFHDRLQQDSSEQCQSVAALMVPSCYKGGCIEGKRYCGRDVSKLKTDRSIPPRRV